MAVHLTKRWGGTLSNPEAKDLRAALAELDVDDPEHPDCWLEDELGWGISAFGSGLVIFENVETNEGPWHMRRVSREQVLELWNLLRTGRVEALRHLAWKPGYGGTR
jgi:hypothetical protein